MKCILYATDKRRHLRETVYTASVVWHQKRYSDHKNSVPAIFKGCCLDLTWSKSGKAGQLSHMKNYSCCWYTTNSIISNSSSNSSRSKLQILNKQIIYAHNQVQPQLTFTIFPRASSSNVDKTYDIPLHNERTSKVSAREISTEKEWSLPAQSTICDVTACKA